MSKSENSTIDYEAYKEEIKWYDFLERKNRYIGGMVETFEGDSRFRGVISSILLIPKEANNYFVVIADEAEEYRDEEWKLCLTECGANLLTAGCSIQIVEAPIVDEKGIAKIHVPYVGTFHLIPAPQSPADFEGKVVVMTSGVKDAEDRMFSVESCEAYAQDCQGIVEYLDNGEARVWASPEGDDEDS